jgi:hypothetical protein
MQFWDCILNLITIIPQIYVFRLRNFPKHLNKTE